jgi:hypothetical protein
LQQLGAGLLVGAGAIGAGVFAYKKHEEHKEEVSFPAQAKCSSLALA